MIRTVRLDPGLRPSARIAHRNALLTLPADFRIVDGEADVVVSERPATHDDLTRVVIGVPAQSDPASWWADTPVDWERGALRFAAEVADRIEDLHALSVRVECPDEPGFGPDAAVGLRLAEAVVPDSATALRVSTERSRVVNHVMDVRDVRISVTAVLTSAPSVAVTAKAVGHGFLATLAVPSSDAARTSMFELATSEGVLRPTAPYSSAARELWLRLAATA